MDKNSIKQLILDKLVSWGKQYFPTIWNFIISKISTKLGVKNPLEEQKKTEETTKAVKPDIKDTLTGEEAPVQEEAKGISKITKKIKRKDIIAEELAKLEKDLDIKTYIYDKTETITPKMIEENIKTTCPYPAIENANADRVLLLVDDIPFTEILYQNDFKAIKDKFGLDIKKEFRLVKCFGEYAGFTAYKYAVLEENKIDLGFLDITLGHKICLRKQWYKEIDGIDIAILLRNVYPDFSFLLCTAHTLNMQNQVVQTYDQKVQKYFGIPLEQKYLPKNSDRLDRVYNHIITKFPDLKSNTEETDDGSKS